MRAEFVLEGGRDEALGRVATHAATRLLLAIHSRPERVAELGPQQWMDVLAACRRARCLGHLSMRLAQAGVLDRVESRVLEHMQSATRVIERRRRAMRWELVELGDALRDIDAPAVALKGAAYELADLPLAAARVASDVDLLVSPESLPAVEARLKTLGWESVELSDYDERYYREWSHEIPALVHPARGLEVDVHHSIAPGLRGDAPAARDMLASSRAVSWSVGGAAQRTDRFNVLSPTDQLVHVAIHTFAGSELSLRLREVMDFDLLYRHWCVDRRESDAAAMLVRADELGLARAVWWMLHFSKRWLATPVPDETLSGLGRAPAPLRLLMDRVVDRAMLPGRVQRRSHREFVAEVALLARYQWQRLPIRRLVPHVLEKARRRLLDVEA
jgi:hypothetical protein